LVTEELLTPRPLVGSEDHFSAETLENAQRLSRDAARA
jgi:hypothetical protein